MAGRFPVLGAGEKPDGERQRFPAALLVRRLPRRPARHGAAQSPAGSASSSLRTRATGIDVANGSARIELMDGAIIEADRVLIATGNSPAAGPLPGVLHAVQDAWDLQWIEELPTYVPRVLLVGTGLTMVDMVLAIADQRPDTRMLAISRHGLLPQRFEDLERAPPPKFDAQALLGRGPLSRRLHDFRADRSCVRRQLARGIAAGARDHALALARGAAAPASAVPAPPSRLLGHASPPSAGRDAGAHRSAAQQEAARDRGRPPHRDAAHQGRRRRRPGGRAARRRSARNSWTPS